MASARGRAAMSSRNLRNFARELIGAPRRFAIPERNGWRRAVRILHANAARFHAPDAPGRGAQQEDVARQALDGEIFVQRSDRRAFGFGDHQIVGGLRNGSAGSDGRQPRAAPPAHPAVDLIAMQERSAAAALRGDAVAKAS